MYNRIVQYFLYTSMAWSTVCKALVSVVNFNKVKQATHHYIHYIVNNHEL